MKRILCIAGAVALCTSTTFGAATLWNFNNPDDPLAATAGPGTLSYHDPDGTGWGAVQSAFGTASSFGLPAMPGGDADVMRFPACGPRQGYRVVHGGTANGAYDTQARVSNYTLIMDVLYPTASDARWRGLYQTDTNNANDAEFYVQNAADGGIGIIGVYNGSVTANTWHRIAIVMQAAPGEGKCQRFIDGRFVGGIGSTGSGLDVRWALSNALLLFADNDSETASGYVSSIYFVDRAMRMEEIEALGGPHAAGTATSGAAAPPLTPQMPRPVGVIGHRGGFFCCAPDNTMAAVRRAISNNVPMIEIDTRLSADGVCMLMHDSTVDRTTDGTGAVAGMTVAQLKALDAGSWFSPEFAGERVPTLVEVMTEAKGKMILYFDLKVTGQINAITNAMAQTGFNANDCWFWVYDNVADAADIRSKLPNAKIIWGDPPATWSTDPNFFSTLRSRGVYGFDLSVYYGTVNTAFLRAAKAEGFMVAIYTILDPDTMARNAAAGVDYMETDFPQVMNALQPPQSDKATGPSPANGAFNVSQNPLLTWITASNATSHRVYFGQNPPLPLWREQAFDGVPLTNLTMGVTYFWRVDEVTPSGTNTGDVWAFTVTTTPPQTNTTYEWTFDNANLDIALGDGVMEYADGASGGLVSFGNTGSGVPNIGGRVASYMRVPAFSGLANGLLLTFNGSGPNGSGAYINQFTWIADMLVPGTLNWVALFNTNPENANDADFYISPTGQVGTTPGYSLAGTITVNTWYRVAFVANLTSGKLTFYVNGALARDITTTGLLDGRYSLFSNADPGPDLLLFNEGDTSGQYTHELYVNSVAFKDQAMSAADILALGAPRAEGIFVRKLSISRNGSQVQLSWAGAGNVLLQKATSISPANWQTISGTLGASSYSEATGTNPGFYRLAAP